MHLLEKVSNTWERCLFVEGLKSGLDFGEVSTNKLVGSCTVQINMLINICFSFDRLYYCYGNLLRCQENEQKLS